MDKSFVRNALIDGVGFQEMIGANPFKYGIVAGADSHIAASANEEFNYPGVHGNIDHSPKVRLSGAGSVAGEPAVLFGTPGATGVAMLAFTQSTRRRAAAWRFLAVSGDCQTWFSCSQLLENHREEKNKNINILTQNATYFNGRKEGKHKYNNKKK